ncbi:MAG: flavin reductase family protein [Ignavibacteriales bacterium]|nr:flavin reductase family protein [Ignavibacteriales bacterium]
MSESIDPKKFRQTVGQFATGVAVIAAEVNKEVHGMTANAFTSLSLNPMLVLFCVDKRAKMSEFMQLANGFSINFLRDDQQALSTYFAGGWKKPNAPPFRFVPWDGGPRLEGCASALGCRLHSVADGGDHSIIIGEVIAFHLGIEPRDPLVFHSGMYRKLDKREKEPAPPDFGEARTDVSVFLDPWDQT